MCVLRHPVQLTVLCFTPCFSLFSVSPLQMWGRGQLMCLWSVSCIRVLTPVSLFCGLCMYGFSNTSLCLSCCRCGARTAGPARPSAPVGRPAALPRRRPSPSPPPPPPAARRHPQTYPLSTRCGTCARCGAATSRPRRSGSAASCGPLLPRSSLPAPSRRSETYRTVPRCLRRDESDARALYTESLPPRAPPGGRRDKCGPAPRRRRLAWDWAEVAAAGCTDMY